MGASRRRLTEKSAEYYNAIIMQRKLIRVGTSVAVLIPKAVLEEQGVHVGDMVHVEVSKRDMTKKSSAINPELIQWTDEFIAEYKGLLKKLADA